MAVIYSERYAHVVPRAETIALAALRAGRPLGQALEEARKAGWNRQEMFVAETVIRTIYDQNGGRTE